MPTPRSLLTCLLTLALTACGGGGGDGASNNNGSGGGGVTPPPVSAQTLPLLNGTSLVGVVYSGTDPAATTTLDAAFAECVAAGADTYQLSVTWASLESAPGTVDVSTLRTLLTTVHATGLRPYLLLKTIDTSTLTLPADLTDPAHADQLAPGLSFNSPTVITRFSAVLDQVVPLLIAQSGFALSVGNEVDPWLATHAAQQTPFLAFLDAARQHAHGLDPRLAITATCTAGILDTDPTLFASLLARSDAACFTYYPLDATFTVREPTVVAADLARLVTAAGDRQVLLQEAGYPSGYAPGPGNGSTLTKQADFVTAVFTALAAQPRIRFCSFLHLADYTPADVATFSAYYGSTAPLFVEFLSTLGLRTSSGAAKPAYQALLNGLGARTPAHGSG